MLGFGLPHLLGALRRAAASVPAVGTIPPDTGFIDWRAWLLRLVYSVSSASEGVCRWLAAVLFSVSRMEHDATSHLVGGIKLTNGMSCVSCSIGTKHSSGRRLFVYAENEPSDAGGEGLTDLETEQAVSGRGPGSWRHEGVLVAMQCNDQRILALNPADKACSSNFGLTTSERLLVGVNNPESSPISHKICLISLNKSVW